MTSYSTDYLSRPETERHLAGLITGLIRVQRGILDHPDFGNLEKLTALRETLMMLAPPPPSNDPAAYAAMAMGRGAAGLAEALRSFTGPATYIVQEILGEPVTVDVFSCVERILKPAECALLNAPKRTAAIDRKGVMTCGPSRRGMSADITSLVIPTRLPRDAEMAPNGNVPLGIVLAKTGRREPIGAVATYGGGVASVARMWVGAHPVAWVTEEFKPWFCKLLERPVLLSRSRNNIVPPGAL